MKTIDILYIPATPAALLVIAGICENLEEAHKLIKTKSVAYWTQGEPSRRFLATSYEQMVWQPEGIILEIDGKHVVRCRV